MTETTLWAAVAGALAAILVLAAVYYIIYVIANWRIFTKAGEKGWKSLIPVYNEYVLYKLTWKTTYFWLMLALAAVMGIAPTVFGDESAIGSLIVNVLGIIICIIDIIATHKVSKAFGHGAGFTLGLIFLNPIFILILAFGGSEYIGNTPEQEQF